MDQWLYGVEDIFLFFKMTPEEYKRQRYEIVPSAASYYIGVIVQSFQEAENSFIEMGSVRKVLVKCTALLKRAAVSANFKELKT